MEIELYYERCRALLEAIVHARSEADADALLLLLEEQYHRLGELIEKSQILQS
jgi:hypothetical protein